MTSVKWSWVMFYLPNFMYGIWKELFRKAYIMHTINLVGIAYTCISWLPNYYTLRSIRLQMFFKIGALKKFANFTRKHLSSSLFLIELQLQLYQKEIPADGFFCEICEIFKNTFLKEYLWWLLLYCRNFSFWTHSCKKQKET